MLSSYDRDTNGMRRSMANWSTGGLRADKNRDSSVDYSSKALRKNDSLNFGDRKTQDTSS